MAGRGPAPKDPDERARQRPNSHVPERGDWVSVPPLTKTVLPVLPKGVWSSRTRATWKAWRADWVTGVYGPAEIAMTVELAYLYEQAVSTSAITAWGEVRQWMDRLGLTMKGKRDLRLRLAKPAAASSASASPAFAGLRLVDDAVAS